METFVDVFFETLLGHGPWFITAIVFYFCGILCGIWIGFSFQKNKVPKPKEVENSDGVLFKSAKSLIEEDNDSGD
ncbi:hypothetical protein LCGC14_1457540 [marine sediment metagenome]|uniref:Uncharacterized protein n=1 Tax=marine sediment metagenome TaxID=412755 RepID=A0A0F9JG28_9ZZZZ